MPIDDTKIRLALRSVLIPVSGATKQWEGRNADLQSNDVYIREVYIPGKERRETFGFTHINGIYEVDVLAPAGSGTEAMEALVKAVRAAYQPPKCISHSDQQLVIIRVERGRCQAFDAAKGAGGAWQYIPVFVYFRSHIPD